jgi:hypothetical protein
MKVGISMSETSAGVVLVRGGGVATDFGAAVRGAVVFGVTVGPPIGPPPATMRFFSGKGSTPGSVMRDGDCSR